MLKAFAALVGLILLSGSGWFFYAIDASEKAAVAKNDQEKKYGMIDPDAAPPCSWTPEAPDTVMSDTKSQAIVVHVTNNTENECESFLSLRAPGFDISPVKEEQSVQVPPKGQGAVSWIITPDKTGTFEIAISDVINTQIYGITVTNMFGLSAIQAKVCSILGTLFGPMLTVPWWWDRWHRKKKPDQPPKETEE